MRIEEMGLFCAWQGDSRNLIQVLVSQLNLSAGTYHRMQSMKLVRTITELAGSRVLFHS